MKITTAGVASKILAIVDEIQKNTNAGLQRRLDKAASDLEDIAFKLVNSDT